VRQRKSARACPPPSSAWRRSAAANGCHGRAGSRPAAWPR
jgi:hypothetical protein